MRIMRGKVTAAGAALLLIVAAAPAFAQQFHGGKPVEMTVMFGAGRFGYFLTDSKYSSTTFSAGPDTQPNTPATTRSSCGSISMLYAFG